MFNLKNFLLGGEITTWNDNNKRLDSFIGIHQTTVKCLCWSSNGTRLLTGDQVIRV